jgi:flagellar assembly factor FliW
MNSEEPTMSDLPVIHLAAGLPGFPGAQRFLLVEVDAEGPFRLLRSLDVEDLELLVTNPHPFFPTWEMELPDHDAERIGLTDAADAVVLAIVTTCERPEDATANLFAPIVVSARTLEGAQVVLGAHLDDLRRPLFETLVPA